MLVILFFYFILCHFINFYLKNLLKLAEKSSNKYDYYKIFIFFNDLTSSLEQQKIFNKILMKEKFISAVNSNQLYILARDYFYCFIMSLSIDGK